MTDVAVVVPVPRTVAAEAVLASLAGEPALIRIVRALGQSGTVVVAAAAPLEAGVRAALADFAGDAVVVAAGGSGTRADCVAAALQCFGADESPEYVLLHDVRRPLVSTAAAARVVEALRGGDDAVAPALAVTDSVKSVDARGVVTATVDRAGLADVQYPRGFSREVLAGLLAAARSDAFDELAEALHATMAVHLDDGDPDAVAAELPREAAFLEAIIACRGVG